MATVCVKPDKRRVITKKKYFFKAKFVEIVEQGSYTSQSMSKHVQKMFNSRTDM